MLLIIIKGGNMKPIRKDEQEYLKRYIERKFDNRRSALESERQS